MKWRAIAYCAALLVGHSARGATVMHVASIPLSTTNWNSSVTIPKFDSTLGTLEKIIFKLDAAVQGTARFESQDAAATTVTMLFSAAVKLQRPDLSDLVVSTPSAMTSDMVTAYDGVLDFGGTSGRTYNGLMGMDLDMAMLMAPFGPVDTANFIGGPLDMIILPVQARGTSMGSGAGNLFLSFATMACANIMITYDYTIPEPATLGLLLGGGCLLRRRRLQR